MVKVSWYRSKDLSPTKEICPFRISEVLLSYLLPVLMSPVLTHYLNKRHSDCTKELS